MLRTTPEELGSLNEGNEKNGVLAAASLVASTLVKANPGKGQPRWLSASPAFALRKTEPLLGKEFQGDSSKGLSRGSAPT